MNFSNSKKVSAREMKRVIMKANRWTEEQYSKKYHLFKNKLRAYESFMYAHGRMSNVKSPVEMLYQQAKRTMKYGKNYTTKEFARISKFSAVSITKGRKLASQRGTRYEKNILRRIDRETRESFKNLIDKTHAGKVIMTSIADPLKREEALKALADYIAQKRSESKDELFATEFYGSDELSEDFDYSVWLD